MENKSQVVLFNKDKELSNCTFVKTILMIIVVLYHSALYWQGSWFIGEPIFTANALGYVSSYFNSFHIYGFTLVSGYLFYALKYENGKYKNYLPFVINKSKRLLIPYLFVSLIWAIPFAIYFFNYNFSQIIKYYLFGTSPSQLWFLLMLFFVFIFFFPLANFFKEKHLLGTAVILLCYAVGYLGPYKLPNILQIFRALTYMPLFFIGFKIRQFGSEKVRKIPWWIWLLTHLILFVFYNYISAFKGIIFSLLKIGTEFILHIVGAIMAFVLLQKIADNVKWKESKVFNIFSKNSMPVYLFHQQIIYVFVMLLNGVVNPYLHAGINFIGAIAISFVISFILMKFKWTRFLIGEK